MPNMGDSTAAMPQGGFLSQPPGGAYDMQQLKDWVAGAEYHGMANRAESLVLLHVTHENLTKTKFCEIRFDRHMTIMSVKEKLRTQCGTAIEDMVLTLLDHQEKPIMVMDDNNKKLGYYSPEDGMTIHIVDMNPQSVSYGGQLTDTSLIKKYEISDEEYMKREKNFRKWKQEKLAEDPTWTWEREVNKNNPNWKPKTKVTDPEFQKDVAENVKVGSRCMVNPGERRGEVKFVGQVEGLQLGYWIGVQYDEPLGKHNGTVKGKQYFECPDNYGGFVRPEMVTCGDFPPVDEFDFSDDEI